MRKSRTAFLAATAASLVIGVAAISIAGDQDKQACPDGKLLDVQTPEERAAFFEGDAVALGVDVPTADELAPLHIVEVEIPRDAPPDTIRTVTMCEEARDGTLVDDGTRINYVDRSEKGDNQ